jgi:hypothetical protein
MLANIKPSHFEVSTIQFDSSTTDIHMTFVCPSNGPYVKINLLADVMKHDTYTPCESLRRCGEKSTVIIGFSRRMGILKRKTYQIVVEVVYDVLRQYYGLRFTSKQIKNCRMSRDFPSRRRLRFTKHEHLLIFNMIGFTDKSR